MVRSKCSVVIERDEDGIYVASVPALQGCYTQGKTRAEALKNIRDAIELHIAAMRDLGEPVPCVRAVRRDRLSRDRIMIEKAEDGFSAFSPDLPGCVATGRTEAEAGRRMRAAIKMHLDGLKEDKEKTIRCGKCRVTMRGKPEVRLGLKITIQECPRCGKRLIGMDDAIRLQKRAEHRMREIQKTLGDAARRKGISKKDLLISVKVARKRE